MKPDSRDEARFQHINGFVSSFVERWKADRYRSLVDPKRRSEITDDLNHKLRKDLKSKYLVATPPTYRPDTIAYLISDDKEVDDRFVESAAALELLEYARWGTVASIVPGVLVAFKEEPPSKIIWMYREPT